jgi:hypothetical protein
MIDNGKSKIEDAYGILSISIPSKKNWFILIFGISWLGGWYMGFTGTFSALFYNTSESSGINIFFLVWILGWTLGGIIVIFLLLWGFFGKEEIVIEKGEFLFSKTVFKKGIIKRLDVKQITKIRVEEVETSIFGGNQWSLWGLGPGKIKFDYGMKTYSFGLAVDEAEADYIAALLIKKIS